MESNGNYIILTVLFIYLQFTCLVMLIMQCITMILIMYCHPLLCTVYTIMLNTASLEEILMLISKVNSMKTASLQNFVSDKGLMFCTKSENCINIDYTHCGPNQAFSVIDHLLSLDAYRLRLLFIKQSVP